eukprot:TRINITY_DN23767_c0_g1_i1.p1 TRINITY_DN23767_c0_g1~~TRINITY_DN23767_c0_g1_i1.p1  ORF type:complete len:597 (+),score=47.96 TRINITY_DN23767_c0_g1_i1:124-1914(+)
MTEDDCDSVCYSERGFAVSLQWMHDCLIANGHRGVLELGSKAVGLFFDIWLDAGEGALRTKAAEMANSCLSVLEDHLISQEPLVGPVFLEALAILRYRTDLDPARVSRALLRMAVQSAESFKDPELVLSCPPSRLAELKPLLSSVLDPCCLFRVPLHDVVDEYITQDLARRSCHEIGDAWKSSAHLTDLLSAIAELRVAWPGSRSARDLEGSLMSDLRIVASIARGYKTLQSLKLSSQDVECPGWLLDYARVCVKICMTSRQESVLSMTCLAISLLRDFDASDLDPIVNEAQTWIRNNAHLEEVRAPPQQGRLWDSIYPTWIALRSLQPRSAMVIQTATNSINASGLLQYAPPLDLSCWMGVPDAALFVHDDHLNLGELPVVHESAIGGPGGRGLFVRGGGKPRPLELSRDHAYGQDGFLCEAEYEQIMEEKSHAYHFCTLVTLGVWFRDEFSSGALWGTVRPVAAVLPTWMSEGRCVQDISWDAESQLYSLDSYDRTVFIASSSSDNLAAMCNDALFGRCTSEAQYEKEDRMTNNMVMVPCARPCPHDSSKVEFSCVWIYPRFGWRWEADCEQELTLGYGYDEDDSVNLVALKNN